MSSAPQLLNSVIEEKMSRVSEVLIGSVTPFELMMGKLVGGAAVCVLLATIYVVGALGVANYWGYGDAVAPSQLAWFAFFLVMAVLLFGSIFVAVGAACTDLKDSQNLMTPVMLIMMLPMITAGSILRAPDGMVATVLSLIPTATPFLMMLRISMHPGPPAWQVALSAVFVLATVLFCVWAAGRIFRTGLLMQGKSASLSEMIRWVRQGLRGRGVQRSPSSRAAFSPRIFLRDSLVQVQLSDRLEHQRDAADLVRVIAAGEDVVDSREADRELHRIGVEVHGVEVELLEILRRRLADVRAALRERAVAAVEPFGEVRDRASHVRQHPADPRDGARRRR